LSRCNDKKCQGRELQKLAMEQTGNDEIPIHQMNNQIFLNYIFDDMTKQEVRWKALEVMIKEFN
jgi:hypothetical protein